MSTNLLLKSKSWNNLCSKLNFTIKTIIYAHTIWIDNDGELAASEDFQATALKKSYAVKTTASALSF